MQLRSSSDRAVSSTPYFLAAVLREASEAVVLDVGSHEGAGLLRLLELHPSISVIAFEPSPNVRATLKRSIAEGGFMNRVRIEPTAVSDESGLATLRAYEDSAFDTLAQRRGVLETARIDVEVTSIDEYVASVDVDRLRAIAIDVGDSYDAVLRGARRTLESLHPIVVLDVTTDRDAREFAQAVVAPLESLGYEALLVVYEDVGIHLEVDGRIGTYVFAPPGVSFRNSPLSAPVQSAFRENQRAAYAVQNALPNAAASKDAKDEDSFDSTAYVSAIRENDARVIALEARIRALAAANGELQAAADERLRVIERMDNEAREARGLSERVTALLEQNENLDAVCAARLVEIDLLTQVAGERAALIDRQVVELINAEDFAARIATLEQQNAFLQTTCIERLAAIDELTAALAHEQQSVLAGDAAALPALVADLERVCEERLVAIEELSKGLQFMERAATERAELLEAQAPVLADIPRLTALLEEQAAIIRDQSATIERQRASGP